MESSLCKEQLFDEDIEMKTPKVGKKTKFAAEVDESRFIDVEECMICTEEFMIPC